MERRRQSAEEVTRKVRIRTGVNFILVSLKNRVVDLVALDQTKSRHVPQCSDSGPGSTSQRVSTAPIRA